MISLRQYVGASALAASAVMYHAFATRRHFFPAALYLSTSKLAVAAVGNLSFAAALCLYNLVIKVFLGALREIELERVRERLSSAIMETCLALTIFREEFNAGFVAMFAALTFVKVFHWLVQVSLWSCGVRWGGRGLLVVVKSLFLPPPESNN
jgi:E3 ubiquitin-protein ligase synoviolin